MSLGQKGTLRRGGGIFISPGPHTRSARQGILQATVRPSCMPLPDAGGWDHVCGYGLLDLESLLVPPTPSTADLWVAKGLEDTGTEPFVAETFWDSTALVLEDSAGQSLDPALVATGEATPARLRCGLRIAARVLRVTSSWPLGGRRSVPCIRCRGPKSAAAHGRRL